MADVCTAERRSEIMSNIRSKNTAPELLVRRLVFGMGYRYRLHVAKLPGTPDIVMPGRKKIIEVRGCFWHGHQGCPDGRIPKTRTEYWRAKIGRNIERDAWNLDELVRLGWQVLVLWECELKNVEALKSRLQGYIEAS